MNTDNNVHIIPGCWYRVSHARRSGSRVVRALGFITTGEFVVEDEYGRQTIVDVAGYVWERMH